MLEEVMRYAKQILEDAGLTAYYESTRKTIHVPRDAARAIIRQPTATAKAEGIPFTLVVRSMRVEAVIIRGRAASRDPAGLEDCIGWLDGVFKQLKSHVGEQAGQSALYLVGVTRSDLSGRKRYGSCAMLVTLEFIGYEPVK